MNGAPRFEHKYRLPFIEYLKVKNWLARFASLDRFSRLNGAGRYFIRSLYFDTFDYRCYAEKMTGEHNRIKLRIRSYFPDRASAKFVTFEIKARLGSEVFKHAGRASLETYDQFEKTHRIATGSDPALSEFLRLMLLRQFTPRVLVDYEREAFEPRDASGVRITFDHALRYAETSQLFPKNPFFRKSLPELVVMEIKTRENAPPWVTRLVESYGLRSVPNSKYAASIEHTQKAMYVRG